MKRLGCRETTFFFALAATKGYPSRTTFFFVQPSFLPKLVYSYSRNAIHGAITENENLSVF